MLNSCRDFLAVDQLCKTFSDASAGSRVYDVAARAIEVLATKFQVSRCSFVARRRVRFPRFISRSGTDGDTICGDLKYGHVDAKNIGRDTYYDLRYILDPVHAGSHI